MSKMLKTSTFICLNMISSSEVLQTVDGIKLNMHMQTGANPQARWTTQSLPDYAREQPASAGHWQSMIDVRRPVSPKSQPGQPPLHPMDMQPYAQGHPSQEPYLRQGSGRQIASRPTVNYDPAAQEEMQPVQQYPPTRSATDCKEDIPQGDQYHYAPRPQEASPQEAPYPSTAMVPKKLNPLQLAWWTSGFHKNFLQRSTYDPELHKKKVEEANNREKERIARERAAKEKERELMFNYDPSYEPCRGVGGCFNFLYRAGFLKYLGN